MSMLCPLIYIIVMYHIVIIVPCLAKPMIEMYSLVRVCGLKAEIKCSYSYSYSYLIVITKVLRLITMILLTNIHTHIVTHPETMGFHNIDVILFNRHNIISSINVDEHHEGNI